jgi:hypothetical protein
LQDCKRITSFWAKSEDEKNRAPKKRTGSFIRAFLRFLDIIKVKLTVLNSKFLPQEFWTLSIFSRAWYGD